MSTTTKPYACDQCEKSYARKDSLTRHVKALHKAPDVPEIDAQLVAEINEIGKAVHETVTTDHPAIEAVMERKAAAESQSDLDSDATYMRTPAWRTLGGFTRKADGFMTSAEALEAGGLAGWNVRKEEMTTESGIVVPDRVANVRTNPATGVTEYINYVGRDYAIQQNEETFDFLDALVDASGAHYDAAGHVGRAGRKVFVSMKLPEGVKIAGEDAIDLYLLATNGHDGKHAFKIAVTPLRLACTNQLTAAMRNAQQSWEIRHTRNMDGKLDEARRSLELTFDYADAFAEEMERLLDVACSENQFEKIVQRLMPDARTKAANKAVVERRDQVMDLFTTSATNEFGRGTRYAAFNALTEYADWIMPAQSEEKRALRELDEKSSVQTFKNRALALVRA